MKDKRWRTRVGGTLTALAVAGLLGACGDLLSVDNPGAITEDNLSDPAMIPMMVNGVIGEFQYGSTQYALYSASLADEVNDVHVWRENRPIDLRNTDDSNGLVGIFYVGLQRARAAGDEAAKRIKDIRGAAAAADLDVARVLTYSGYSLVLLGEGFCSAPIDVSAAYQPAELFGMALTRFDEAIAIATAAKQAGANAAAAEEVLNFARVGAARAALGRNENAVAVSYATGVPASFEVKVHHSGNSGRENNPFFAATTPSGDHIALDPSFEGLNDPRIPHRATKDSLQFGLGFVPLQPSSFSGWNGGAGVAIGQDSDIRLASGLEARYILAEAGGMTEAEILAFVNERRAVGNQPTVNLSGAALQAELRDQRRRDFFLDGHRLGDLRRYKATGVGDFFSTGTWPYDDTLSYGTMECFDIPISEKNSNPNL